MEGRRRARIANCRRAAQRRKRHALRGDSGNAARVACDGRERLARAGGQAGHFQAQENDERLGQRAKAQHQKGRIGGTVLTLQVLAEPVGPRLLHDEIPRHGLGQPQDGKQDEAQREGQAGGSLRETGERDERGDDAPQRLNVPSSATHAGPPCDLEALSGGSLGVGMECGWNSWKALIFLEVGVGFVHMVW